jgi:hypothetical protein
MVKGFAVALMVVGVLAAAGGVVGLATNGGGSTVAVATPSASTSVSVAPSPSSQASPSGSPSPTPSLGVEAVRAFLAPFARAIRSGDTAFLLAKLHPAVITLYGEQQCRTFLAGIRDRTRAYRVVSVSGLQIYDYNPDGLSIPLMNVFTVLVRQTADGESAPASIHLGLVDGGLRWFTDCGTPQ